MIVIKMIIICDIRVHGPCYNMSCRSAGVHRHACSIRVHVNVIIYSVKVHRYDMMYAYIITYNMKMGENETRE